MQLQPGTLFVDFEVAIRNASEAVFPGVSVKGCFFIVLGREQPQHMEPF